MEIVRALAAVQPRQRGAVAAIGNFDGVHLGHRAVIGEAARIAGELHVPLAVLTFEPHPRAFRSEEHTSELQSLMRISYAVFCLKKKKITQLMNYVQQ